MLIRKPLVIDISYFFGHMMELFSFRNNPKTLDPSYKMDLDIWDCLGRVNSSGVSLTFLAPGGQDKVGEGFHMFSIQLLYRFSYFSSF